MERAKKVLKILKTPNQKWLQSFQLPKLKSFRRFPILNLKFLLNNQNNSSSLTIPGCFVKAIKLNIEFIKSQNQRLRIRETMW